MHESVIVLAAARGEALAPDADEVAEAAWLPPDGFCAQAHDLEAAVVRALVAGGQLAAAAALARAMAAAPEAAAAASGDDCDAAIADDAAELARVAAAQPALTAAACHGLIASVCGAVSKNGAVAKSTYYTALGGDFVAAGLRAADNFVAVEPLDEALRASCERRSAPAAPPWRVALAVGACAAAVVAAAVVWRRWR